MTHSNRNCHTLRKLTACMALAMAGLAGCSHNPAGSDADSSRAVVIDPVAPANAVARWSEVAAATINGTGTATTTAEEQRSVYSADMATVHLAIYDALVAITGSHRPFASAAQPAQAGASEQAAAAAAARRVLGALFPNRSALYQPAYDTAVAAIADGDAKARGLAIGTAAANAVLNLRANDGRLVVLAPYVPGTGPGQFRGNNPILPFMPSVRPFALLQAAQFRPAGPPALTSAAYARDLDETRSFGGASSSTRSAAQTDTARFHTEPPQRFWTRNMVQMANQEPQLADAARLMALLWVVQADASIACFEAKFHYQAWRPASAIALADTDGNPDTAPEPGWTPMVPTPNHPEYPAAHACNSAAVAEALRAHFGTRRVSFSYDSQAAGLTSNRRSYASTDAMATELSDARIWGGMHFRTSGAHGGALGEAVARWVVSQRFQRRD